MLPLKRSSVADFRFLAEAAMRIAKLAGFISGTDSDIGARPDIAAIAPCQAELSTEHGT